MIIDAFWRQSGIEVYNADALEAMRSFDDDSFDLIVTDPPYFKVKGEWWDRQWDKPEGFLDWMGELCGEWARLLKGNGSLYVFASPRMAWQVEGRMARCFSVLENITWVKPDPTCEINRGASRSGQCCKESLRSWFPRTEEILFAEHYNADNAAKGESGYGKKCDELRGFVFEPIRAWFMSAWEASGLSRADVDRACGSSNVTQYWFLERNYQIPTADRYGVLRKLAPIAFRREYEDLRREYEDLRREYEDLRRPFNVTANDQYTDVWTFKTVQHYKGKHPCEKPLAMMEHILRASGRAGCRVLDCFAGSGTTLLAAKRLGFDAVGVEIELNWCEKIRDKLSQRTLFSQAS